MDVFHEIVPGFCSFIVNLTFLILTTSKETICYIRMGFLKTPPDIFHGKGMKPSSAFIFIFLLVIGTFFDYCKPIRLHF